MSAHDECPQTRFVSIGDREADVYDLLAAVRPAGVELLIRAAWDRCVRAPERSVWATVAAQPVVEQLLLQVPRRGAQPARAATLALRFCRLTRCPPRHRQAEGLPEVVLWAVQVREVAPPAAGQPIEWLLVTTVAVDSVEDARERVQWYAGRWGICIVPSITVRPRRRVHPRWARPCAGSRSLAALWGAAAATNQGLKRCGVACNI